MPKIRPKRSRIYDIGAGNGNFVAILRGMHTKNPQSKKEVIGLDREAKTPGLIRESMGSYFSKMSANEAEKIHSVWLNHVEIRSSQAHKEFLELAKKIPRGVPIIFTVRQQYLTPTVFGIEQAGLKIVSKKPYSPKTIGSETTKEFLNKSKREPDLTPIRIVAIKK